MARAMPKVAVVDYHKGNISSVVRALETCGAQAYVSDDASAIASADAVVLPGVGAFRDAMETIRSLGLDAALLKAINDTVPFLGICLGLHLLFDAGEEHADAGTFTPGLGVLPGVVLKMPRNDACGRAYKIPHVGWNSVHQTSPSPIFNGLADESFMYFTHSYIAPESDATIANSTHSVTFPCAVQRENVFGVQFHPEKSSDAGLRLLTGFIDYIIER